MMKLQIVKVYFWSENTFSVNCEYKSRHTHKWSLKIPLGFQGGVYSYSLFSLL